MVTALSQTEDRLRGAIEGAVRYLTKPFHPRELLMVLDELLSPDAPPNRSCAAGPARMRWRHARIESGNEDASPGEAPRVRLTRRSTGRREMLPARVSETRGSPRVAHREAARAPRPVARRGQRVGGCGADRHEPQQHLRELAPYRAPARVARHHRPPAAALERAPARRRVTPGLARLVALDDEPGPLIVAARAVPTRRTTGPRPHGRPRRDRCLRRPWVARRHCPRCGGRRGCSRGFGAGGPSCGASTSAPARTSKLGHVTRAMPHCTTSRTARHRNDRRRPHA